MVSGRLLSDDLFQSNLPMQTSHPVDSSRLLLGLMTIAHNRNADPNEAAPKSGLDGIISTSALKSLLAALHFRDVRTLQHSRRVALLSVGMAHYLGWDSHQQKIIEVAALLHDMGKIGVPDNVLFKPGKLSPDEAELMALHCNIAIDVLQACHADKGILEILTHAHTYFNGSGDDDQRFGREVHQGTRILTVADAYDSLATDQVYRKGRPHDQIMEVLMEASGTQFDGNVVSALSRWIQSEGLPFSSETADHEQSAGPNPCANPTEMLEASSLGHIFSYLYVLESLYDGFYIVDSDLRISVWNLGLERLLGRPSGDMLGQIWTTGLFSYADADGNPLPDQNCPMKRVISGGQSVISTVHVRRADGRQLEIELQSVPLLDQEGRLHGVAEIFRDLSRTTRRPREYRELKMAASRDALTSVANRGELETQLALMIAEFDKREQAEPCSILFLDIDHFKSINDTYGHTVGDQVLIDVARLLQHEMYSGELIGRYGGEEFVILCPGANLEQAVRRAERLRTALPRADIGGLCDRELTASFGIAQAEPGDSVESLLRRADKALYSSKNGGRNKCCSFTGAQLLAGKSAAEVDETKVEDDPFEFEQTFHACIAADMIVYKLGGFIDDQKAQVVRVTPDEAVLRLGKSGWLPFWGKTDARRPIELTIEFGGEKRAAQTMRAASSQVEIKAHVRPLGRIRDPQIFQNRATRVLKVLRSFFAAR